MGGVGGGFVGVALGKALSRQKRALRIAFGATVVAVDLYVSARGLIPLANDLNGACKTPNRSVAAVNPL